MRKRVAWYRERQPPIRPLRTVASLPTPKERVSPEMTATSDGSRRDDPPQCARVSAPVLNGWVTFSPALTRESVLRLRALGVEVTNYTIR